MEKMTLLGAAKAIGAECREDKEFCGVCTDTRKITPGCLFVALKGENFDGHAFASKAIESGAVACVVEKDCGLAGKQLLVKSTGQALLDLAGAYRNSFDIEVLGITGSVGKTTTKEMCHCVLSAKFNTLKNEGNLNNEIGVPTTLFRLDSSYTAAVIEMGMSHFNEIDRMTRAVRPDAAVISNIGVSHIENLGSRENILKAKLEILNSMQPDAPLILNGDDDMLKNAPTGEHRVIYYGIENKSCQFRAENITGDENGSRFTAVTPYGNTEVDLPIAGLHNVYNALSAMAAGSVFGISMEDAAKALADYVPSGMRQKVVRRGGVTVIEDCYNASPASQKAALGVLGSTKAKRRIAVLGDMKELGSYAEQGHRDVGKYAAENRIDVLITLGDFARYISETGKENGVAICEHFSDKEKLNAYLHSIITDGDAVLFKASRAMKLEECISSLYDFIGEETK